MVTAEQIKAIYKEAREERISTFLPFINKTLEKYSINTPTRIQYFLAQIGHESGQLNYEEELASGKAYENRKDLGNTSPGDGVRYKGRGLIQITGKNNYAALTLDLDVPFLDNPELLKQPQWAVESAGWFWNKNNLNSLCDLNLFQQLTRRINGGLNGYADRYKLLQRAMLVIK